MLEVDGEEAVGGIERLANQPDQARVPVKPDDAAGPGARPRLAVGGSDLLRVLAEEVDVSFEGQHLRFALPFGLLGGALPELEQLLEVQDVRVVIFADANVPGVFLAQVEAQGVRPDCDADADIAVAQQHAFEETGGGQITDDAVAAGDLESIQGGLSGLGGGGQKAWGSEERSSCGSHGCSRQAMGLSYLLYAFYK